MLDLIKTLLEEFREKYSLIKDSQSRIFQFPNLPQKIKVAIGVRRAGKTFCVLQKVSKLIEDEQVSWQQILYLNLEDDRLSPCSQEKLRELIESFYETYPQNHDRLCYLFFDEIQNVVDWPVLIRRIFDSKKTQIFLTGSSSKLLSKEIHTSLRGRAIATEVWPYGFYEYLQAKQAKFTSNLLSKKNNDLMTFYLKLYLQEGGFPEVINLKSEMRRRILQDYVDVVVMRDVVERHGIHNITLIKYMIKSLLKNISSAFSINKFFNDLRAQGLSSAKNTLYNYLDYLEDAYLIFGVSLYSESIRKSQTNPRKIYAVDTGLIKAYTFGLSDNFGHFFENLFFLELRRRGHQVYYYLTKERYEVDFLTIDPHGKLHLYQVVWDITDGKTLGREKRALEAAEEELKVVGELITPQSYIESVWREFYSPKEISSS